MSDYKAIASSVEMTNQAVIVDCLRRIGITPEFNVVAQQKWSRHNRQLAIVIRQNQLPEKLRGFGDVGLDLQGGKYVVVTCGAEDSRYIDGEKRAELATAIMQKERISREAAMKKAVEQQPDGKYSRDLEDFLSQIPTGYALRKRMFDIKRKCPSVQFSEPSGEASDPRAWMVTGSVSASDLKRMGIAVPN